MSAALGAATAVLLVGLLAGCGGERPLGAQVQAGGPRSTGALIDSIGVVVHFNYADTAYGRQAEIVKMLSELGVRHIRDAVVAPGIPLASGLQAAARVGIRATLATGDIKVTPATSVAESLSVLRGSIDAFEGPNEIDNSGIRDWTRAVAAYMPALAGAVRQQAPGVRLIGPSFLYPGSRQIVPSLPGLLNLHPYPLGGPPEAALQMALTGLPQDAVSDGVVFTETGYHNALLSSVGPPPVSEQAAAIYLPRLLLSDFAAGIRATFLYEFADEKPDPSLGNTEDHFGLVHYDLSPKPAFLSIRTLMAALQESPGPGRTSWPMVRSQGGGYVWRLRLVRPDGSKLLALWRPISVWDRNSRKTLNVTPAPVELNFDSGAKNVAVWRPSLQTGPVTQFDRTSSLRLALGGDLVLISFR